MLPLSVRWKTFLEVYQRPYSPDYPLVCFDESSKQLVKETRIPLPMRAHLAEKYDYEYERNGVAQSLYVLCPLGGMAPCQSHPTAHHD